jgi:hypothetical protein
MNWPRPRLAPSPLPKKACFSPAIGCADPVNVKAILGDLTVSTGKYLRNFLFDHFNLVDGVMEKHHADHQLPH